MKKIRNNVFETNSSSTHCITVSSSKYDKDKLPITVNPNWNGDFGWDFETWDSIEEKLAYMIRCLICNDFYCYKDGNDDDRLIKCIKPIQEKLHSLGIDFDIPTYNEYSNGYVDHEDWYKEEIEDIYNDNDDLLKFLLNDDSYIEGGNDNC